MSDKNVFARYVVNVQRSTPGFSTDDYEIPSGSAPLIRGSDGSLWVKHVDRENQHILLAIYASGAWLRCWIETVEQPQDADVTDTAEAVQDMTLSDVAQQQLSKMLFEARELIDMFGDAVEARAGKADTWARRVRDEIDAFRRSFGWNDDGFGGEGTQTETKE